MALVRAYVMEHSFGIELSDSKTGPETGDSLLPLVRICIYVASLRYLTTQPSEEVQEYLPSGFFQLEIYLGPDRCVCPILILARVVGC